MSITKSLIGQTIVKEECYENENHIGLDRHHFLTTAEGHHFHLMNVDEFDQYASFTLVTEEEKKSIISDWPLTFVTE